MCGCTSTHIPCICSYVMHTPPACYILSPTTWMCMYLCMHATPSPHMAMYDGFHSRERGGADVYHCVYRVSQIGRPPSALDPDWGTSTIPKDTLILLHTDGQWLSTWGPVLSLFQDPFHPLHPGLPGRRHCSGSPGGLEKV